MEWYAVRTKAKQEKTAEHHLSNQNFDIFLPLLRVTVKRGVTWNKRIEPLFPGYLFVKLDVDVQSTASIRSTRGVVGLVKQGDCLLPVPSGVMDEIIALQEVGKDAIEIIQKFKAGEEVTITHGPMAGLDAIYKAKSSEERVIVLLNILGGETRVAVPHHCLAKAS